MTQKNGNVVKGNFSVVEEGTADHIIESLDGMEFDDLLVIGVKGHDTFMAHTDFDSRTKLMGNIESLKMWLWMQGYFPVNSEK